MCYITCIMKKQLIIRKRIIEQADIDLINSLILQYGEKGRTFISSRLCEKWDWRQANGHYKEITCRELLRKLDSLNLIKLPPMLRSARKVGYKNKSKTPKINEDPILEKLKPLKNKIHIKQVRGTKKEKDFNGLIEKFHYLGYHQGAGEQLKYLIYLGDRIIACIGFGCSALKVSCRDKFIGWDKEQKSKNLNKVVNNSRFLILPWVNVPHLASFILGKIAKRIKDDWKNYYNNEIFLLETFVDTERYKGTCYKAAGWECLGQTTGRGRNDRYNKKNKSVKLIFVKKLSSNFKEVLHD